jgi:succinate dehydrogenase/fumarate reductase flavoprotein subunit
MLGVVGGSSSLCAAMKAKRRGEMPEVLQKFLFSFRGDTGDREPAII